MRRKILSMILVLSLLLSMFSVLPAQAADSASKVSNLSVGSFVIFVSEEVGKELTAISTTSTKYGIGTDYSGTPAGTMLFEVCAGYTDGTYAFKNEGKYLYWGSGNSLTVNAELSAKSSWNVTFDADGNAAIINSGDTARQIWWNNTVSGMRFACYTGKTADKSYKSLQIYAMESSFCLHSLGDFVYSGGKVYQTCSICGQTVAVTMHTTTQAKAYTDTAEIYNVWGIVTYISGTTVYIEDASGGLCVYFSKNADLSSLALGQKIFVSGSMTTFQGLPEMDRPESYLLISSGNSLPNSTKLSIADITGDATFAHLGKRVTLTGLRIGSINPVGYTSLTDEAGNSLSIYRAVGLNADIVPGNIVTVTGIISYYDDGFQLVLNPATAATDVIKTGEGSAIHVETVPISVAKSGADEVYYQVEGIVTAIQGRMIFIQDDTGGIVIYLPSDYATAPCAVGDKVRAYGAFGNYEGQLELQYVDTSDPAFFSILSSNNAVVAQPVTIDELLRDSSIDYEYFAEKIFLNDVSILEINDDGTVYFWQDDCTIAITECPGLSADCVVGAVVDVTATISGKYYNYSLVINSADDVRFGGECPHTEIAALDQVNPTCTTDGYSGDIYCTICGTFISSGYVMPAQHSSVLINAVEPGCDSAGFTGDEYCEMCEEILMYGASIPALGHDYQATITEPTCTENGSVTHTCSRCNDSYVGEELVAPGHSNTYAELDGVTHAYCCTVCGASGEEEHAFDSGRCLLCGAKAPDTQVLLDETIKILHSLNLASDISINFVVAASSLSGYDSYYLECTRPVYEGNKLVGEETVLIEDPRLSGNYYYFTLTGTNALEMGDMVKATLYMTKGTAEYCSKEDEFSVATYAYGQLNASSDEKLLRLCANLLRYGATAQLYKGYRTDALVDAAMTDAHRAYLTDLSTVTFGNNAAYLGDLANPTVTWLGRTLVLDTKVILKFVCNTSAYGGNVEDLTLRVSYRSWDGTAKTAVVTAEKYGSTAGWYSFSVDCLLAAELRQVLEVAVYSGETRLSETARFSVDSYGNNCTGTLLTVCQSLIAYSDSALAYFSK